MQLLHWGLLCKKLRYETYPPHRWVQILEIGTFGRKGNVPTLPSKRNFLHNRPQNTLTHRRQPAPASIPVYFHDLILINNDVTEDVYEWNVMSENESFCELYDDTKDKCAWDFPGRDPVNERKSKL